MKARQRSLTGLLLAIILIPVLAGLLACLPVPIGDPERSRLDPALNGLWLWAEGLAVFEPYDKRTWLVVLYEIDISGCPTAREAEAEEDVYASAIARFRAAGSDCLRGELDEIYKAWLTDIGRGEFMTWEPKGQFDEDYGFLPKVWLGWRLNRIDADEFQLALVDGEFEGFDTASIAASADKLESGEPLSTKSRNSLRRDIERVIRRNLDEPDLYDESHEFHRIRPEDYGLFVERFSPLSD